jgi:hypothetical protein
MLPFFLKQICIIGFYSINGNEIKFELRRGNPSIGERRKGGYTIVRLFFLVSLKNKKIMISDVQSFYAFPIQSRK